MRRQPQGMVPVLPIAVVLLAFAAITQPGTVRAAQDEIEEGRKLAEQRCARCHAVGFEGESPHPDAPPFREFSRRWNVEGLEEALAEGIVTGHPDMPEIVFEPEEIGPFIDYLRSLSDREPGR